MDEFKNRLRHALEISGMTQAELAKSSGVSKTNIVYILNGRNASTSSDNLVSLARALGVSVGYLAGETDNIEKTISSGVVLHYIHLSAGSVEITEETKRFERSFFEELGRPADQCVLYKCTSDSMSPLINHGDSVIIDRSDTEPTSQPHVFAFIIEGGIQLARLQLEFGQIFITRTNPAYPTRSLIYESFLQSAQMIGRVIDRFGSAGL